MLRERILPSGIGHTTNCFIQVEASENGESYLIAENSDERKNVKSGNNCVLSSGIYAIGNYNPIHFLQFLSWRTLYFAPIHLVTTP